MGETLTSICKSPGMPAMATVIGWALDEGDPFSKQYARARLIQAHGFADMIRDITDNGRNDWMLAHDPDNPGWKFNGEAVQRSRLRADKLQWLLSKALPKVYGDKLDLTTDGEKLNAPTIILGGNASVAATELFGE